MDAYPEKERPAMFHAFLMICLASVIAIFLASGYAWDLIARTAMVMLDASGIRTQYVASQYLMYVRLLDGSVVGFKVLIECSGLITLLIFSFISAFTIGLLKGNIKVKTAWFILSMSIGFIWNLSRLAAVVSIAYNYGLSAFYFAHFVLGPMVDFVWVVSTWSLGMSWLRRENMK
ncbi:MAG: archaeosortase/exosortase family protein [Nitrososphaerota archaeon]|nr:archaeosortase/exosortase family protein [Candidatus Bathyarchaeota archaeon]MDW8048715.1 archaeosortase/exosortase family protein [Nitrososphaerota archaeon]